VAGRSSPARNVLEQIEVMAHRYPIFCASVFLLAGCAANAQVTADQGSGVRGYLYHDANHSNQVVSPSPQAIYNGTHGTWLWPPAENDRPG
jgi:hypothetical protein